MYHTCRALLVHRRDDLATFDRAFDAFWREHHGLVGQTAEETGQKPRTFDQRASSPAFLESQRVTSDVDAAEPSSRSCRPGAMRRRWPTRTSRSSRRTRSRWRAPRWRDSSGPRASAGHVVGSAGAAPLDLRRALAQSVRTGGDVVELPRRKRRTRERPLVLLCDISGSMERYSRMLLHFAHADRPPPPPRRGVRVLHRPDPRDQPASLPWLNEAAADVSRSAPGWSGGTRIGEALRQFQQRWTRRTLHGGPVVLLISDGWDCGDPVVLRDQIKRLQRSCHRLIWLNPLIGTSTTPR